MSNYVKARRAHSMPTRYCIPSAEMGEYEEGARRHSAPLRPNSGPASVSGGYTSGERKTSMLYPLSEEGAYGAPPRPAPAAPKAAQKPPASAVPFSRIRERKPKVYSSYAVDSNCNVHSKKLADAEKESERSRRPSWSSRRTSASPARRISSASPSRGGQGQRAASSDRAQRSKSPEANARKYSAPAKTPGYSSSSWSTSKTTTTSSVNNRKLSGPVNERRRSSSYNRYNSNNNDLRNESFEESEEYEYAENNANVNRVVNRSNARKASSTKNYSAFGKEIDFSSGLTGGGDGLSLGSLKQPQINSWDSMGILGLSSKMFADSTSKRSDNFFSSTTRGSSYLREDNYNIM